MDDGQLHPRTLPESRLLVYLGGLKNNQKGSRLLYALMDEKYIVR